MAIKALIPANQNTLTVGGLYQWDYGQVLEIECTELGSEVMEVHFACRGMEEAIVRPCTFSNGVGTVNVPDRCLEQTNDIVAWVYKINSTQGHTVKTITLPVVSRTRPSKSQDIPTEYINQYDELIEEINEVVNAFKNGDVPAAKATHAVSADSANTAMSATSATRATFAESANSANSAGSAMSVPASGVRPTKVFGGEYISGRMLSMENFIKPLRRYIVCLGEKHYTGYSNYSGNRIDFGGNIFMSEGRDNEGFVWTGTVSTSGEINYGGEGYGVNENYLMILSTMYGEVTECSEQMGSPKITAIYECETVADIISFTIDGTTYIAAKGMTWAEWIASTSITSSLFKILNGIVVNADGTKYVSKNKSSLELSSDVITTSAYTTVTLNGGMLDGDGGEETISISFTIGTKTYQAKRGMTWAEWCESSYNTISTAYITGAYIDTETSRVMAPYVTSTYGVIAGVIEGESQPQIVYATDTIIKDGSYLIMAPTAG